MTGTRDAHELFTATHVPEELLRLVHRDGGINFTVEHDAGILGVDALIIHICEWHGRLVWAEVAEL